MKKKTKIKIISIITFIGLTIGLFSDSFSILSSYNSKNKEVPKQEINLNDNSNYINGNQINNYSKEEKNKIENKIDFFDLINSLVASKSDYSVLTQEYSPIKWQKGVSSRHKDKESKSTFDHWYFRKGETSILFDNRPTHYILKEKKEAVLWTITLEGSRGFFSDVVLTNTVCSEFSFVGTLINDKIDNYIDYASPGGNWRNFMDGIHYFKMNIGGKLIHFYEIYSCGSCGCSSKLIFNINGEKQYQKGELVENDSLPLFSERN